MSQKKPWENFAYVETTQALIRTQWGEHLRRLEELEKAEKNYAKAELLQQGTWRAAYGRGMCKLLLTEPEAALESAQRVNKRTELPPHPCNLLECDAWYELGNFEQSLCCVSNKRRPQVGHRREDYDQREVVLEQDFGSILGDSAGACLWRQRRRISKVLDKDMRKSIWGGEVFWKRLLRKGECDVQSVVEEEQEELHVKEAHRKECAYNLITQVYFQRGASEVKFLRDLKNDPRLCLSMAEEGSQKLLQIVDQSYEVVIKRLKMLNTRFPIYTYKRRMFLDESAKKRWKETQKLRNQLKNRLEAFKQLDQVHMLRSKGNTKKLVLYTEQILGQFYPIKNYRNFPRKCEFVIDICNIVALTYCDRLKIPKIQQMFKTSLEQRLYKLLDVPNVEEEAETPAYEFGNKKTFHDPLKVDESFLTYKSIKTNLENRLKYVQHLEDSYIEFTVTEQCYLMHEIALLNLIHEKFEDARTFARRLCDKAERHNLHIWHFLGDLMLCKVQILKENVEKLEEKLLILQETLKPLKSKRLELVVDTAIRITRQILNQAHPRASIRISSIPTNKSKKFS